jgi:transcriptional regulator
MVYLPRHFTELRPEVIGDLIRRHSFATLVTHGAKGLVASQLPFILRAEEGEQGTLYCHLARPNPQVADLLAGGEALVIASGPSAYVSPSWYAAKPAVPTWNYASVHAYGTPRPITEPAALERLVGALAAIHETGREPGWRLADEPAEWVAGMLRGIIGFAIPIARIEGKFKLSQNRSREDRARVVAALQREAGEAPKAVAAMMRERDAAEST